MKRLPEVVSTLSREETELTGKKPVDAIYCQEKAVYAKSSTTHSRPVGLSEKRLGSSKNEVSLPPASWEVVEEEQLEPIG